MTARSGLSLILVSCASLIGISPASSATPKTTAGRAAGAVQVEPGTIATAIATIARTTGVEIVSLEPGLASIPVRRLRLPADPAAALDRLLHGTGYQSVPIPPRAFRIVRRVPAPPRPTPDRVNGRDHDQPSQNAITVVAGKFPTPIRNYPGTLVRLPDPGGNGLSGTSRVDDIARQAPVVFSTAFGDGRDKIFIRGIADSSFNGASQPTTAIYFDDAPVGFGSPNANLRLYDIGSVEVLEGPQGTLYGGGSIGGVIRITPRPVDLAQPTANLSSELRLPTSGDLGWKLGGAINLPVLTDKAGIRLVGYDERSGGFIDVPGIAGNANRVDVAGGRFALAVAPDPSFKLDFSALYQRTRSRDAQYVDMAGPDTRHATVLQPFGNELAIVRAAARKTLDSGLQLSVMASYGHRTSSDRFDAAQNFAGQPSSVYDWQRSASSRSAEFRLAQTSDTAVNWVLGVTTETITDGQSRAFGRPDQIIALDEVTNVTHSGSLFAQARWLLRPGLQATLGLRYTIARTDSEPARRQIVSFIRGETARHADPTLALLWQLDDRISAFARFQTGYRNGGVTVAQGVGRVSDFKPDSIAMGEAGLRLQPTGDNGLSLAGTISYAGWTNVLAELITRRGTPITTNVGNARIFTLETTAGWKAAGGWSVNGALLYTANRLNGDLPAQTPSRNRRLPDTPSLSARLNTSLDWRSPGGCARTLSATLRYVGPSMLGPGQLLDLGQGDYALVDTRLTSRHGPLTWHVGIENLFNARANRFALGNPLLVSMRSGFVPLTPRTLSAGISLSL